MLLGILLQHPLATAGNYLRAFRKKRVKTVVFRAWRGVDSGKILSCDALLVMGGPMNAYEEKKYPFLFPEGRAIKKFVSTGKPFLGVCLGAQLLAKAFGARVLKMPSKEVGAGFFYLTAAGRKDGLFKGFPKKALVLQWHEDTFALPRKGVLLASGRKCRNQSFKIGPRAYGIQFHLEPTPALVKKWVKAYSGISKTQQNRLIAQSSARKRLFEKHCFLLAENFVKLRKAA
ncbi:type 1 glutamine amidotransferase [Candidatus Micrarchaeota archaeon]|nr:type 1 glutamine amidotransferase [Candidatus Micrarchaeota archaeon]